MDRHQITLSGPDNWEVWKFRIVIVLKNKNCYEVCTEDIMPPADSDDKAMKEWNVKDRSAQDIITSRMEEKPLRHLLSCKSAFEMWKKLLTVYDRKSEVSLHVLQQKFFAYEYKNEGISSHLSTLEDLASKMKTLGEEIPEKMLITKIIMSLPEEYKYFQSAWESSSTQTLSELTSRLLIEEERLFSKKGEVSTCAFVAKVKCKVCGKVGHYASNCFSKNKTSKSLCYYCKKPGHFIKNCKVLAEKDGRNKKLDVNGYKHAFMTNSLQMNNDSKDLWVVDSGATEHMSFDLNNFDFINEISKNVKISDGTLLKAKGIGDVSVKTFNGKQWVPSILKDVLYVPDIKINLFSVTSAIDKGHVFLIEGNMCKIVDNDNVCWILGKRYGNLYKFCLIKDNSSADLVSSCKSKTLLEWHYILAHQNFNHVERILKNSNINYIKDKNSSFCDACCLGKQHTIPYHISTSQVKDVCEVISADLCGPMEINSLGGCRYFLLLKDHYSKFRKIYFLKNKGNIASILKEFFTLAKRDTGREVKFFRSDRGTEFMNRDVQNVLKDFGIRHQKSAPYCPPQNGRIEREMRTVVECARTMLYAKKLDKCLWAEATNTAVYILNCSGTSSVEGKTPWELWFGDKYKYFKGLEIFGSEVYAHVPNQKRHKWDPKSKQGIFVGYEEDSKVYRIYFPKQHQIEVVRNVMFKPACDTDHTKIPYNRLFENLCHDEELPTIIDEVGSEDELQGEEEERLQPAEETCEEKYHLRKRTELKKPSRFSDYEITANFCDVEDITFDDAFVETKWRKAMQDEMDALMDNKTWSLVELPDKMKALTCKWVFRKKPTDKGDKEKARLVVRGFEQKPGIDFKETFSPVASYTSIRLILAIAAKEKLNVLQFDVKTAFLNGDLSEELYMEQPEGFHDGTTRVCKLLKSIYGLKQAPKNWNIKFTNFLKEEGFITLEADPCVFVKFNPNIMIVTLYVDDGLIVGTLKSEIDNLLIKLNKEFKITYGLAKVYLGIDIKIKTNKIILNQINYIDKILTKFKMKDCIPVKTPMIPNYDDTATDSAMNKPFREAIGSLLYLSNVTRPDIAYSVNYLSRHMEKPLIKHWNQLKRIFRYLKGTRDLGLTYFENGDLEVFTDADFAGEKETSKSTSGYVVKLSGAAVAWGSRKQTQVAQSTADSEFVSACEAIKETLWINHLLLELKMCNNLTPLYVDNKSAIHIINRDNGRILNRTKHVRVKYHYVIDNLLNNFSLQHVPSDQQIADIFTKPLEQVKFVKFRDMLGVKNLC